MYATIGLRVKGIEGAVVQLSPVFTRPLSYDVTTIKRVDALFQVEMYLRIGLSGFVCMIVWQRFDLPLLIILWAFHGAWLVVHAGLIAALPQKVGWLGIVAVFASTLIHNMLYVAGLGLLWIQPILIVQVVAMSAQLQGAEGPLSAGKYVEVRVADTGIGISHEDISRVCEPYFTTKRTGRGVGLGLSMAKGFAEQSGGAIHIDSTVGEGTEVALFFPVPFLKTA